MASYLIPNIPDMRNRLYSLIQQNEHLQYIDARTGELFTFKDFHESLAIPEGRGLAFLYLNNSIASVEVLLNFLNSDHTVALLSAKLSQNYKEELEKLYQPAFIYDSEREEIARFDLYKLKPQRLLFQRSGNVQYTIHPDIKLLLSTSGSTGSPKFVKLSEENILQNALSILDYLPVISTDVTPLNLPLYYSYGFSVFTTNSISAGKVICTDKDIMQKDFWEEFEKHGYTSIAGVPYVYEMLLRLGFLKKLYPSLRYLTQAGGKLNENILRQFAEYASDNKLQFYTMYGQTEATARISYLAPEMLMEKAGSIGKPIKNGKFSLDQASGELLYSGPNVFGGYCSNCFELAEYQTPEVLHTGDIAINDGEGFYYITGRMKRMVKLFGNRINLDDIENLLKNRFTGSHFVCLGLEDKYLLVAYSDGIANEHAIKDLLFSELKINKNVIKVQILDSVPLTVNGKVDYQAAQRLLA